MAFGQALDELGNPSMWKIPSGYPSSLALCVMDSIWSIGIQYRTVEKVLNRFMVARGFAGIADHPKCVETPSSFLDWLNGFDVDPVETLVRVVNNRNLTSSTNGALKAAVVIKACELLRSNGLESCPDLLVHRDQMEGLWRGLPGQGSGISWRYVLMLAGGDGVKPDRMVQRFLARHGLAEGRSADESIAMIVTGLRDRYPGSIGLINMRSVDYQIWSCQRSRSSRGMREGD